MSRKAPPSTLKAVVSGLAGVAAGVVIFLVVLAITGPKSTEQSASATFKVGSAERLARTVDRDGPLLFQDLLNRSRDIYVQHLTDDEWRAFEAHAPGAPRRCVLEWRRTERQFADPCSGRTFPADGTGLTQFPTEVDEAGVLIVNLAGG
ncbi:MAG: hypothetical protein ACRD2W_06850 [Acidimicrobiales bacterium]